jgi:hypothetical protein
MTRYVTSSHACSEGGTTRGEDDDENSKWKRTRKRNSSERNQKERERETERERKRERERQRQRDLGHTRCVRSFRRNEGEKERLRTNQRQRLQHRPNRETESCDLPEREIECIHPPLFRTCNQHGGRDVERRRRCRARKKPLDGMLRLLQSLVSLLHEANRADGGSTRRLQQYIR